MISRVHSRLVGFAAALLSAMVLSAGTPVPVAPTSKPAVAAARAAKQSEDITQRIDGLLKQRLKPDALPRDLPNPFAIVSGMMTTQRDDSTGADAGAAGDSQTPATVAPAEVGAPLTSTEMLARCAATLKFGGMILLNGQVHVVINNIPRKEGDVVSVSHDEGRQYLRVVRILPGSVTMRLDDAEQVIRF